MGRRVGIDVGGTFTDAVLIDGSRIEDKAKVPTHPEDLLTTILNAIDSLQISGRQPVEQITVSTTLVTNAILQGRFPHVELCLLPGSGMSLSSFTWPVAYQVLAGAVDYRGLEISPVNELECQRLVQKWKQRGRISHVAVVGKFSHRNKVLEEAVATYVERALPEVRIALGYEWGQSNFYRRSLTTYLNLASHDLYNDFADKLQAAVVTRGFKASIYVLKGDGGVLPLRKVRPVESIYSGPTASVLGALAQSEERTSFVVVDIGGTTTDLGIVLSGSPLVSTGGAQIGSFSTLVRSLAVRSVPVGGDSVVITDGSNFSLAAYRLGPAFCLGGPAPTPTDAMCYLGLVDYGNRERATEAMAALVGEERRNPEELSRLAQSILDKMVEKIARQIEELQQEWQEEPAYKVWEVLHPHDALNFYAWVSGGAALGIAGPLGQRLHAPVHIGKYPGYSNAIGAAMAKPTFSCTLHLDTFLRRYRVEESGEQGEWTGARRPHQEVAAFLTGIAQRQAAEKEIELLDPHTEPFDFFPIVHGYQTVGQIVRGAIHVAPGVVGRVEA